MWKAFSNRNKFMHENERNTHKKSSQLKPKYIICSFKMYTALIIDAAMRPLPHLIKWFQWMPFNVLVNS